MANDINVVTLTGRLVKPSELKYTKSGMAVVSFAIATNTSQRMQDGSWGEWANFFDCTWYGKGAEALNPYLTKGRQVTVSGELRQRRWEDQNGAKRSAVGINVNDLNLGSDGRQQPGQAEQPARSTAADTYNTDPPAAPEGFGPDDNIPF